AIVQKARGRRLFPAAPQNSLLLRKPAALEPHGGGKRLEPGGDDYETLYHRIAAGTPRQHADAPALERIRVEPDEWVSRLAYDRRELEEELTLIELIRSQMSCILLSLQPADLRRRGVHPARGPMTLEEILRLATDHIPPPRPVHRGEAPGDG